MMPNRQSTLHSLRTLLLNTARCPRETMARTLIAAFGLAALSVSPASAREADCDALTSFEAEGVVVSEAVRDPEGFCRVAGTMDSYTGLDGNPYAIGFELRLPDDWNGDYVHQFNGGIDGVIVPATSPFNLARREETALGRGFAVVSSNAGHVLDAHPDQGVQGPTQFGYDFRARVNYGYGAVMRLDPVARRIVEAGYGDSIRHAYGVGRSNGGRHALVAAARMPDAFDGLLVGYPGFNLPKAAVQHAWDAQIFHELDPGIRQALTQDDLDTLSEGILDRCDGLDGLEDGLIFQWKQCQARFEPAELTCTADRTDGCLDAEKIAGLERMMAGPSTSTGEPLYSEWYWDSGFNSGNWRSWKLEGDERTGYMPRIIAMGAASLAQVFTTPPQAVGQQVDDLLDYLLAYDFDEDPALLRATTPDFPESSLDFMVPPGLYEDGFEAFRQAGGKMIVYHGLSDPVFSAKDTVDWFDGLPNREAFARLFLVPAMPHGHSAASPDDFDLLGPLVAWVENGTAPDRVEAAKVPETDGAEAVVRPLCAYPQTASYTGSDPADVDSFSCAPLEN